MGNRLLTLNIIKTYIFTVILFLIFNNQAHSYIEKTGSSINIAKLVFFAPITEGIPDVELVEDSRQFQINLSDYFNVDEGVKGKNKSDFTYSLVSITNGHLFSNVNLNSKNGMLRLNLGKDEFGNSVITVRVTDKQNEFIETAFSVLILPVNDRPSFSASNPPAIERDAGRQTLQNWAVFDPGAANESDQTAEYIVENITNADLFSEPPTVNSSGTLVYAAKDGVSGTSQFGVKVRDNGGTANGGIDESEARTFTIEVKQAEQPAIDFTASDPPNVLEDQGPQQVQNWAAYTGVGNQKPNYTVDGVTNPALFQTAPRVNNDGVLSYTTAKDAFGSSGFTVTAKVGNATSEAKNFTITVIPVNDRPSFNASNPPAIERDAGRQTLQNWAVFDPGANESDQTEEYIVGDVSNPDLFSEPPTVNSSGTLVYAAKDGVSGTSQFGVKVRDNGGTANGGIDESEARTFTIEVKQAEQPAIDFTASDPPDVLEDQGPQEIRNWAILIGGKNNQKPTYLVDNITNSSLFATLPNVDGEGTLRYTADKDEFGVSQFDVMAKQGNSFSEAKTFQLNVIFVNDEPYFEAADLAPVKQNSGKNVIVNWARFNPGSPKESNQKPTYLINNITNPGIFANVPNIDDKGTLSFAVNGNNYGQTQFHVRVKDDGGTANGGIDISKPQAFMLEVLQEEVDFTASDPPEVLEDQGPQQVQNWAAYTGGGNQKPNYSVDGVTNPGLFQTAPRVNNDGVLSYTTAKDAFGSSEFTVTAKVGNATSEAKTFTITVIPVNDRPSFSASNPPAIERDAGRQTLQNWAIFDPGAANESEQKAEYIVENITNAALFSEQPTVNANGTLAYAAKDGESGSSQFSVKVRDDGGTANGGIDESEPQTFTIEVKQAEQPVVDFTASNPPEVLEDQGPQQIQNWAAYTGGGNQKPNYTVDGVTNPGLFQTAPRVNNDGVLSYTTAKDAFGSSQFTVTAKVGNATSGAKTFTVTVIPVNDRPSFTASNPPAIEQDAGRQTLQNWAVFDPGAANESDQTAEYIVGDVSNPDLFSEPPTVNSSGTLVYAAKDGVSGTSQFGVKVRDNGGTANGGIDESEPQTFTIEVKQAEQPAVDFTASNPPEVLEDQGPQQIQNWAAYTGGGNQKPNYTVDGVTNPGLFQTAPRVNNDGVLSYTTAKDAFGSSQFTVTAKVGNATSGAKTFTVTVIPVNDRPSFTASNPPAIEQDAGRQTLQNWAVFDPGAANESDQTAEYIVENITNADLFSEPPTVNSSGTLVYAAKDGVSGTSQFGVKVRDNGGTANGGIDESESRTFTIEVKQAEQPAVDFTASDPPEVLEDQGPQQVQNWAAYTGGGNQKPNYTVDGITNPGLFQTAPRVNNDGVLSYTTAKDAFGSSGFTVTAKVGNATSVAKTFTITVTPVNDRPSFDASNPPIIQQGAGKQTIVNWAKFNPGAPNESHQTASYLISNLENPEFFVQPPAVDQAGTLTYHIKDEIFGATTFGVQVQDNGGTAHGGIDLSTIKIFKITVNEVKISNTPPYFISQPVLSVLENVAYEYQIKTNDAETAPNNLSIKATLLPSWLNFTPGPNGTASLAGRPNNNHVGTHHVVLEVSDGNLSTEQRFTIEVINVNNIPFFISNPNTGAQIGNLYTYNIIVDDIDHNDVLTIEVVRKPSWMDFEVTGEKTAVLSGTPSEEHTGAHHIVLKVTDRENASAEQEFYLIINEQPVVMSFTIELEEDNVHTFTPTIFKDHFNDINNLGLASIRILDIPAKGNLMVGDQNIRKNGEVPVNDLGRLRYVPDPDYFGNDKFTWMGSNGTEYSSNFSTVGIVITPVNDAPRLVNMESSSLAYVPGKDRPKKITNSLEVIEPDGDRIVGAQIILNPRSFVPEEDLLIFKSMGNIEGTFSRIAGILTLRGEATAEDYQKALRSIEYHNISNSPSYEIREFSIYVDDGEFSSNFVQRNIQLIDGLVELEIPSAFTPNDDGVNDYWQIQNIHLYPEADIKVFNRSGQVVYSSTYDDNLWDGRYNGKVLSQGAYFYVIDIKMFNKVYSGSVTILK